MSFQSTSEQQTLDLAAALAQRLIPGDIIGLEGPLGSGKTCFVRGLARGLGIDPAQVSSPTFVIVHEYEARLYHLDAYRLQGGTPEELESIGWTELLLAAARRDGESGGAAKAGGAVIAIEWPSRIGLALPDKVRQSTDDADDKDKEKSSVKAGPHGHSRMLSPSSACAVESSHRLIFITFEHAGEHSRGITIQAPPEVEQGLSNTLEPNRQSRIVNPKAQMPCRACGKPVDQAAPTFPFCSKRCKLADLNHWFSESYRVTRPAQFEDEEAGEEL